MSASELKRVGVMARVKAGTLTLGSAAALLGISYRQAKRVYRRYRVDGPKGLKHRSAGRSSNRGTAADKRTRGLALIREKYSGTVDARFGPTLASEHLVAEDGIQVDHETRRRWMLAAGLWSRARKRSPHRRRRERQAHFGELVQLDGSFHPWFERRGPTRCLLTLVDDATGRSLGRFSAQETIWAAVAVLRAWIDAHGIPQALYTDWKNVYVRPPTDRGRAADGGRAVDAIRPHVRAARDSHHSGQFAASEGSDRAESRHATGSPGQEAAPAGHCRHRRGE